MMVSMDRVSIEDKANLHTSNKRGRLCNISLFSVTSFLLPATKSRKDQTCVYLHMSPHRRHPSSGLPGVDW